MHTRVDSIAIQQHRRGHPKQRRLRCHGLIRSTIDDRHHPNPGQEVYSITPPFFEKVSIRNKTIGAVATTRFINIKVGTEYPLADGTGVTELAGYENILM